MHAVVFYVSKLQCLHDAFACVNRSPQFMKNLSYSGILPLHYQGRRKRGGGGGGQLGKGGSCPTKYDVGGWGGGQSTPKIVLLLN